MKKSKKNAYTSNYYKGSSTNKAHTVQERRKTIGDKLSFGAAEAYKLLRTNLMFSMSDERACKVIGVTSSMRGEGKSTTSLNLAYTLAETRKKVILIEADMRIPVAAKVLGIDETIGLSNVLAGIIQLNGAVQGPLLLNSLFVLPAGEIPPNPSELLSSSRMAQVLEVLSKSFDYIIIDLPPVTAVSDSLAVSKLLSGMVVVVRENYCDRHSLADAMRQMKFLNVKILGFLVNDADSNGGRYKKYKYQSKDKYAYEYRSDSSKSVDKASGKD